MFPAAGDGSGTFVFRRHLRRSLHVYCAKVRFSGAVPLVGFYLVAKTALATTLWCRTDDETLRTSRRCTQEVVVESLAAPAWHRLSNRLLVGHIRSHGARDEALR